MSNSTYLHKTRYFLPGAAQENWDFYLIWMQIFNSGLACFPEASWRSSFPPDKTRKKEGGCPTWVPTPAAQFCQCSWGDMRPRTLPHAARPTHPKAQTLATARELGFEFRTAFAVLQLCKLWWDLPLDPKTHRHPPAGHFPTEGEYKVCCLASEVCHCDYCNWNSALSIYRHQSRSAQSLCFCSAGPYIYYLQYRSHVPFTSKDAQYTDSWEQQYTCFFKPQRYSHYLHQLNNIAIQFPLRNPNYTTFPRKTSWPKSVSFRITCQSFRSALLQVSFTVGIISKFFLKQMLT